MGSVGGKAINFGAANGLRIQWSNPWGFESPLWHYAQHSSNGDLMKRKNEIPDFSKKKAKGPQPAHGVPEATKVQQPPPAPPVRTGKPPATSMKSGRRGS